MSKDKTILDEAKGIIYGDREQSYGHPSKSLNAIAAFWSVLFGIPVTAVQVCQAMILLKQARLMNEPTHRDSWVDTAGYASLPERLSEPGVQDSKASFTWADVQKWLDDYHRTKPLVAGQSEELKRRILDQFGLNSDGTRKQPEVRRNAVPEVQEGATPPAGERGGGGGRGVPQPE